MARGGEGSELQMKTSQDVVTASGRAVTAFAGLAIPKAAKIPAKAQAPCGTSNLVRNEMVDDDLSALRGGDFSTLGGDGGGGGGGGRVGSVSGIAVRRGKEMEWNAGRIAGRGGGGGDDEEDDESGAGGQREASKKRAKLEKETEGVMRILEEKRKAKLP